MVVLSLRGAERRSNLDQLARSARDCFASLAMTGMPNGTTFKFPDRRVEHDCGKISVALNAIRGTRHLNYEKEVDAASSIYFAFLSGMVNPFEVPASPDGRQIAELTPHQQAATPVHDDGLGKHARPHGG